MAAERQRRLLDATGESPLRQMAVEAPQTVHVDRPVVDPHALNRARGSGGLLTEKNCLVDQIQYICHFHISLHCDYRFPTHTAHWSLELAWWASSSIQSAVILATAANA